jgi:hypothetical protein
MLNQVLQCGAISLIDEMKVYQSLTCGGNLLVFCSFSSTNCFFSRLSTTYNNA